MTEWLPIASPHRCDMEGYRGGGQRQWGGTQGTTRGLRQGAGSSHPTESFLPTRAEPDLCWSKEGQNKHQHHLNCPPESVKSGVRQRGLNNVIATM